MFIKNKNFSKYSHFILIIGMILIISGCTSIDSDKIQGEENATLTDAPFVPPPIDRDFPTKVIIHLEVKELNGKLADGVEYTFWTFGGKVPGKFIRIREGDLVEFYLHNHPANKLPHNIDLHAVTGPGGGAEPSFTAPGYTSKFSFKALNAGLFVYHCATAPVGMHIANGMYGLILVEPKEGLPEVDKEYYIMQSEFYTEGNFGDPGLQQFSTTRAIDENPSYVVFNGSVGSMVGENAIKANVGETVRLFVGNGGPNLVSSFHVIGEIFDLVNGEGGTETNQKNVQTTIVPAGGSAIVQFKVQVPGTFIMVDHSIFRAFNKGALAMLKVNGNENSEIFSGKQSEQFYTPVNSNGTAEAGGNASQPVINTTLDNLAENEQDINKIIAAGKKIYQTNCVACHQSEGQGMPNVFPPLAKSDYLMSDKMRSINVVKKGMQGQIAVNGKIYNGIMPAQNINDAQIAAVLTYVRNSWGNKGDKVSTSEVKKVAGNVP